MRRRDFITLLGGAVGSTAHLSALRGEGTVGIVNPPCRRADEHRQQ
jgi:hypothetical protein